MCKLTGGNTVKHMATHTHFDNSNMVIHSAIVANRLCNTISMAIYIMMT